VNVWSFDLATKTGVAVGSPPEGDDLSRLNSYSVNLKANNLDDVYDRSLNFRGFLDVLSSGGKIAPDLIVFEAPLDVNVKLKNKAGQQIHQNSETLLLPPLLVSRLRDFAADHRIQWQMLHPNSVRKSFIDKMSGGSRDETKKLVIQKCMEFGYVGDKCSDDNRCDAIAMWHVTQTTRGKWQPPIEIMFGRRVKTVAA
jgi:hypothetical protein